MPKPKETVLPAIGEYFQQVRKLSQDSFERVEPPIKAKLEPFKMPTPSEKQGITGRRRESVERVKGKRESVKPASATRRDAKGKLVTYKPREQTILRVKMPKAFENEYGIEQNALFSESIEPDDRRESVAEAIKRESLPLAKKLVRKMRNGDFKTDEQFMYCAEWLELEAIAKRANVCLKCLSAKRQTKRRYFDVIGNEGTNTDISRCRPLYVPVVINGKAEYRLWCGFAHGKLILVKRRALIDSKGKAFGAFATEWLGRPYGVPEMVQFSRKCIC